MQNNTSNDDLYTADEVDDPNDPNLASDRVVTLNSKRGKEFLLFALIAMRGGKVTIPMSMMPTDAYAIHVVEADNETITLAVASGKVH